MEGHGDGYPTRFSDYGLNAKDNFEFDRLVRYRQEGKKRWKNT
jgi:hypothetical protein